MPPPNRPPRIGLTTYREPAAWGVWSEPADLLPVAYAAAVQAAGAVAMLLPPGRPDLVEATLDGLDGLLLAGGADVDPARYGAVRDGATGPARVDRDDWEFALLAGALARHLPVLAVCRGMQVLNAALGGDLVQHLPDEVGSTLHCPTPGVHGRHRVRTAEGSRIGSVLGPAADVATYHHQGIRTLAPGLVETAWADDGLVEAVELEPGGSGWVVGVQWHPEAYLGDGLFTAFVEASADRADSTAS